MWDKMKACWSESPEKRPSSMKLQAEMDGLFTTSPGDDYYDRQDVNVYDNNK